MANDREDRVRNWERRTAAGLTVLGVVFLLAYAVPILHPGLPRGWRLAAEVAELATWAILIADFLTRLRLARNRGRFLRTHMFDIAVLVLPAVRPLRVLRFAALVLAVHWRVTTSTRLRLSTYVGGTTVLLVFVASLAVLDAERNRPGANIHTYFDALWWTMTTVSTVGYGDHYPTTVAGRFIAMTLMIGGIGLLGFITGSLASWFIDRFSELQRGEEETREEVADLLTEIRTLHREIGEVRTELRSELAALRASAQLDRRESAQLDRRESAQLAVLDRGASVQEPNRG